MLGALLGPRNEKMNNIEISIIVTACSLKELSSLTRWPGKQKITL